MDTIRKRIVNLLESDWPSTLEQWDSNERVQKEVYFDVDPAFLHLVSSCSMAASLPEPGAQYLFVPNGFARSY